MMEMKQARKPIRLDYLCERENIRPDIIMEMVEKYNHYDTGIMVMLTDIELDELLTAAKKEQAKPTRSIEQFVVMRDTKKSNKISSVAWMPPVEIETLQKILVDNGKRFVASASPKTKDKNRLYFDCYYSSAYNSKFASYPCSDSKRKHADNKAL